jgi:hypothetical protein
MSKYDFTLRFTLPATDTDMDDVAERLYGGGCDDALVGIGHPGSVALDFTRESTSARAAVMSAISDVSAAISGSALIEVTPDLVGVSDVADMVGCSRQNIRKLMVSPPRSAPAPAHEGNSSLWHLSPLLHWLAREKRYAISPGLLDLADATMQVNLALGSLRADPDTEREIRVLLA